MYATASGIRAPSRPYSAHSASSAVRPLPASRCTPARSRSPMLSSHLRSAQKMSGQNRASRCRRRQTRACRIRTSSCPGTPKSNCARSRVEEGPMLRDSWVVGRSTAGCPSISCTVRLRFRWGLCTYWENNRYTPSHGLAPIQLCRVADPYVLAAVGFPAYDCRTVKQDFHRVSSGKRSDHPALLGVHAGLGPGAGWADRRGLVWAVHLATCVTEVRKRVVDCGRCCVVEAQ